MVAQESLGDKDQLVREEVRGPLDHKDAWYEFNPINFAVINTLAVLSSQNLQLSHVSLLFSHSPKG